MKTIFRTSLLARILFPPLLGALALFVALSPADAIVDVNLQKQLGNPSGATNDPSNHAHYLIERTVEAIDYSDQYGQPNWVSWDLTATDIGSAGRSPDFYTDPDLPSSFYPVSSGSYSGSGYTRGHMCPSNNRTDTTANNKLVFYMSNIIPQEASQNGGVWGSLETYCNSLLSSYEELIICGPSGFGSATFDNGHVYVPSNTWKVAVFVPLGGDDSALSRLTNSDPSTIRVIAVLIPNSPQSSPWTSFVISTKQLQAETGFTFFTALPPNLAWVLRSKVDGQPAAAPGAISISPSIGTAGTSITITGSNLDSTTNVVFNGSSASFTIDSPEQITAVVPLGTILGPVSVLTLGGTSTSSNNFAVITIDGPDLAITKSHGGNFTQGDTNDTYTILVTSVGSQPFSGSVTVSDILPEGLTATAIGGTGWAADLNTLSCTRSDGLTPGSSYPPITVTVNVSDSAPLSVTNGANVSGGGDTNAANDTVLDPTIINVPLPAQLGVSPSSGLTSSGNTGGPFAPNSRVYAVTNTGDASLDWTANNTVSWLSLSATSGSLAPKSGANVVVTINGNANNLPAGSHSDTISFTNVTNGIGNTDIPVQLTVIPRSPDLQANGATLVTEGCVPGSGAIDPGELVAVSFSLINVGSGPTANLVATLLATNGVTAPGGAQAYGVIAADGSGSQTFTFTASGVCGGTIEPVIQLQDDTNDLGIITYTIPLGQADAPLMQNFDSVPAPALPADWTTSASGASSNWVTSTVSADTGSNAVFCADPLAVGVSELDSPVFAVGSASAQLAFRQKYNLLASSTNAALAYDGGVLEIKIGDGAFEDILAAGAAFVSGGYNGTISASYSNPLAGRAAWSGYSGGFTSTVVSLPAGAVGQNVQLRWRFAGGSIPDAPATIVPMVNNATLAFYGFDATNAIANIVATNLAASVVTVSNVTGALTYYSGNPGQAIAATGFTQTNGSPTSAYSFFAFSLTPAPGYQVNLSHISLDNRASSTGPTRFNVQISTDATFSSVIYDSGVQTARTAFSTTPMSSFALTNAGLAGTVWFRIYGYAAGSSSGTWRLDNLNVQGTATQTNSTDNGAWYIDSVSVSQTVCCVAAAPLTPLEAWQIQYFGCTDCAQAQPDADPLGKGMSNTNQFLVGLNPTDASSLFRIISVVPQGNDVVVTWTAAGAHTNAVQATGGDSTGNYSANFTDTSGAIILQGSGDVTNNYLDAGGATNIPSRYYRVRLVP